MSLQHPGQAKLGALTAELSTTINKIAAADKSQGNRDFGRIMASKMLAANPPIAKIAIRLWRR